MATYKATSWGRTRRPKTLTDSNPVATKETPSAVAVIAAAGSLSAALSSTTAGENGYITENQKFLHVYVDDLTGTDDDLSVFIYGYTYTSGKWAPLLERDGDGTRSIMEPSCGTSGVGRHFIFEIDGIDRIAFVKSATAVPDNVFAACSTF